MKQTAVGILLGISTAAAACIWDRDTLAHEAKGIPDVIAVITGRFERNPPLYYEMRLERASRQAEQNPRDFGAFDDAGASCDRLGRGDEAVAWMKRKRAAMDRFRERATPGDRYRYLANLGTFIAHRWLRNGANRSRIAEMKEAAELIRQAVALNPDAHFGREKYQLMAMEWIIGAPSYSADPRARDFLDFGSIRKRADIDYAEAVRGISGLIALGNAWESVDMFEALSEALERRVIGVPAYMAELRAGELIDAGSRSVIPGRPAGEELKREIVQGTILQDERKRETERKFRELRADADRWHAERTEFMMKRLREGRHPDTDRDFWEGFRERPMPGMEMSVWEKPWAYPAMAAVVLGVFLLGLRQYGQWRMRRAVPLERL